jgi:hypothetical protein
VAEMMSSGMIVGGRSQNSNLNFMENKIMGRQEGKHKEEKPDQEVVINT